MVLRAATLTAVAFAAIPLPPLQPGSTAPGEKLACATAYERAQLLRKDGKLRGARAEAEACARPSCPSSAVADCTRWLADIEESLPTVVWEAHGPGGAEIYD